VLVRLDHVASVIVNANHSIVRPTVMLRVADCIAHCIRLAVPQATEWERLENRIDAAFVTDVARKDNGSAGSGSV
jgi:hypothetical protein